MKKRPGWIGKKPFRGGGRKRGKKKGGEFIEKTKNAKRNPPEPREGGGGEEEKKKKEETRRKAIFKTTIGTKKEEGKGMKNEKSPTTQNIMGGHPFLFPQATGCSWP